MAFVRYYLFVVLFVYNEPAPFLQPQKLDVISFGKKSPRNLQP